MRRGGGETDKLGFTYNYTCTRLYTGTANKAREWDTDSSERHRDLLGASPLGVSSGDVSGRLLGSQSPGRGKLPPPLALCTPFPVCFQTLSSLCQGWGEQDPCYWLRAVPACPLQSILTCLPMVQPLTLGSLVTKQKNEVQVLRMPASEDGALLR